LNLSSRLKIAKLDEIKQIQIKQTQQLKTFMLGKIGSLKLINLFLNSSGDNGL